MTPLRSSLIGRVTIATAASVAFAALLAAIASWMIAARLIDEAEDQRLTESARVFLNELNGQLDDHAILHAIEEERVELAATSVRIAVFRGPQRLGGDDLSAPEAGCASEQRGRITYRICVAASPSLKVVAGAARASRVSWHFAVGCAFATVGAALAGAFAGRRSARWAVAPLSRLASSLEQVQADKPSVEHLPERSRVWEVGALHDALVALVQRLGESLSRARRFSFDAAHELRTPLTILSAELDLLAEDLPEGPERASVDKVRARARTLGQLVERLLILATSPDRSALSETAVSLHDVTRDVVAALGPSLRERVEIAVEGEGTVNGDETLLGMLIENVVDNALKFSVDQPVRVRISDLSGSIVLEVADRGPGVAAADRARAFDPFYRAAGVRANGMRGHGIGLALVAQIAEMHDATAAFVDAPVGAILRVELPVWRSRDRVESSQTKPERPARLT